MLLLLVLVLVVAMAVKRSIPVYFKVIEGDNCLLVDCFLRVGRPLHQHDVEGAVCKYTYMHDVEGAVCKSTYMCRRLTYTYARRV